MGSGLGIFLMFLALLGGGPNGPSDLLDLLPTETYWKAKGVDPVVAQLQKDAKGEVKGGSFDPDKLIALLSSDDFKAREGAAKELEGMGAAVLPKLRAAAESRDPQVAASATALLKKLASQSHAAEVRRLMAIRTLGEIKSKDSVALLKTLVDSRELFVGEYASRSLAQIEGKPLPKIKIAPMQDDLKFLPKETGLVGQLRAVKGKPVKVDEMIDLLAPTLERRNMGGKEQLDQKVQALVIGVLEEVGNIRIDGMTVAFGEDVGPRSGWLMMSFRGKGDVGALVAGMKKMIRHGKEPASIRKGDIEVIEMDREFSMIVASKEHVIVIGGPTADAIKSITEKIVASLQSGKTDLAENEKLAKLMSKIDVQAPLWAAGSFNEEMQKEMAREMHVDGVENFFAVGKQNEESIGVTITFTGETEKLKTSADAVQALLKEGQQMIPADPPKGFEELNAMVESIKINVEDGKATVTGEIKPGLVRLMFAEGEMLRLMERESRLKELRREETGHAEPGS